MLDTTALLAIWFGEPGADAVKALLPRAQVSAVNLSEALAKYVAKRNSLADAEAEFAGSGLEVAPFDQALAIDAAAIKARHPAANLSFADRACLALALQIGAIAVTSDKEWSTLPGLGAVEQFR